ncbi:unnamed protein product [Cuscuta campestris]|uniref:RNase H type-1 domain-containing protein n=1 Tax=Cuscuta campestris TaxID=132261 RepID=A0A484NEL9_9ASTE|nr:unnamed protein product [Cuscuta campestris]
MVQTRSNVPTTSHIVGEENARGSGNGTGGISSTPDAVQALLGLGVTTEQLQAAVAALSAMGGNVPGVGAGKAPPGPHTEHACHFPAQGEEDPKEQEEARQSPSVRGGGEETRVSAFDRLDRGPEVRSGDLRRQIREGRRRHAEESATSDARSARPERAEKDGMSAAHAAIARLELRRRRSLIKGYPGSLGRGTIDDWDTLAEKFLTHFAANRRQRLPYSHLLNICIRKGEKVRDFIVRWEKEARDVHGADDQALVAMFQAALPRGEVRKELRKNPPPTYQETLARAKFLASEEFDDALDSEAAPAKRAPADLGETAKKRKKKKDYTAGPRTPLAGVYSVGAPMGTGRELALSPLPHVETYAVSSGTKYCEYHRNNTHNTKECFTLQKEMQRLIARGPPPRDEGATPSRGRQKEGRGGSRPSQTRAAGLEDLECVISPYYLCMKFPTPSGIGVARGDQRLARSCYVRITKKLPKDETLVVHAQEDMLKLEARPKAEPAEEVAEVPLDPQTPERKVRIGASLIGNQRRRLVDVLTAYRAIFAWGPGDMPGVDPKVICHRLAVNPESRPVKQKKRFVSSERREFVSKEVATLQSIGHIREPIGALLRSLNAPSRMSKWAMFLGAFQIEFKPRPVIKGQALADFVVECTAREEPSPELETDDWWTVFTDGSSAAKNSGGGVVVIAPEGFRAYYSIRFGFKASNNEAEYEALFCRLRLAAGMNATKLRIKCDSKLVVGHVSGEFKAKDERMKKYRDTALEVLKSFTAYSVEQIPRAENAKADILSKLSSNTPEHIRRMANVEELSEPSIHAFPVAMICARPKDWTDDIIAFLKDGALQDDAVKAKLVRTRAPGYTLEGEKLYKRAYNGTLLSPTGKHHRSSVPEVSRKASHLPLRRSRAHNHRQWDTIRVQALQRLPRELGDQAQLCVGWVPPDERSDHAEEGGWGNPLRLVLRIRGKAPAEISIATHREEIFDPERNEETLAAELHLVHERREAAFIRAENYRRKVKSYHDGRVRARGFAEGDWVLRKRTVSRPWKAESSPKITKAHTSLKKWWVRRRSACRCRAAGTVPGRGMLRT